MLSHMGKNDYKFILSVQKLGASQNIRESQNIVYSKKKKKIVTVVSADDTEQLGNLGRVGKTASYTTF